MKIDAASMDVTEDVASQRQLKHWIDAFDGNRIVAMADDWKTKLASRTISLPPAINPTSSTAKDPKTTETQKNNQE